MNANYKVPFILRFEEEPQGGSLINESDHQMVHDPYLQGMVLWSTMVPWDIHNTAKS